MPRASGPDACALLNENMPDEKRRRKIQLRMVRAFSPCFYVTRGIMECFDSRSNREEPIFLASPEAAIWLANSFRPRFSRLMRTSISISARRIRFAFTRHLARSSLTRKCRRRGKPHAADRDVSADAVFLPMEDRSNLHVVLVGPEAGLDLRQPAILRDRLARVVLAAAPRRGFPAGRPVSRLP